MIGLLIPKNEKIRDKQKIIRLLITKNEKIRDKQKMIWLLITKNEKIRDKQKMIKAYNYEKWKNQRQTKNDFISI